MERKRTCSYGILTDEWEGDCQKSKIKGEQKVQVWLWREVQFHLILDLWFFSFFPRFWQFLSIRTSFLSLSPTGPPSFLFPLPFFLPVPALFLLLLCLSFSVFLAFSCRPRSPFFAHTSLCPLYQSNIQTLFSSNLCIKIEIQLKRGF